MKSLGDLTFLSMNELPHFSELKNDPGRENVMFGVSKVGEHLAQGRILK